MKINSLSLSLSLSWKTEYVTFNYPKPLQCIHKTILSRYTGMALDGAETWTLRATDQKCLEGFEMWCWRRIEKISWTDHVRNEEVLLRVNEQRNILHETRKR